MWTGWRGGIGNRLGSEPVPQPGAARAVLLAGHPGAGKTRLSSLAVSLMGGDAAFINADDYRRYHPGCRALYAEYGSDYVILTGAFSGAVTERLIQRLSGHHLNLVVEGTGRSRAPPPCQPMTRSWRRCRRT